MSDQEPRPSNDQNEAKEKLADQEQAITQSVEQYLEDHWGEFLAKANPEQLITEIIRRRNSLNNSSSFDRLSQEASDKIEEELSWLYQESFFTSTIAEDLSSYLQRHHYQTGQDILDFLTEHNFDFLAEFLVTIQRLLSFKKDKLNIWSRDYVERYVNILFAKQERGKQDESMVVALLDLDRFKLVNDNYGHHTGDQVIEALVDSMNEAFVRDSDVKGRWGGDEFVIVFPVQIPDEEDKWKKFQQDIEGHFVKLRDIFKDKLRQQNLPDTTLSIGVYGAKRLEKINEAASILEGLLILADKPLLEGKDISHQAENSRGAVVLNLAALASLAES